VKKNEDGEVELVLGNGQLLGVFFIVVILLALFFGMGYIMGRNSGPGNSVEVATVHKPEVKPLVVESPVPKSDEPQEPAATESTPVPPPSAEKQQEPKKPEKQAPPEAAKAPAKTIPVEDSPSGVFLQIAAIGREDAELEVEVLKKKNFKAILMEVPEKPGTFRVLVGPVGDTGVTKAREDLQDAGFPGKSAIMKKF
jgi:cell division septation protein DedD